MGRRAAPALPRYPNPVIPDAPPTHGATLNRVTLEPPPVGGDGEEIAMAAPAGPAHFAFIAVVPVVLVLLALGGVVAPALIHTPRPGDSGLRFLGGVGLSPEPLEQARYLLFLLSAPAVVGASILLARLLRGLRMPDRLLLAASVLVELAGGLAILWWWRSQQMIYPYFSRSTLIAAAMVALATGVALFCRHPTTPQPNRSADRRWTDVTAVFVAVGLTIVGLLPSLFDGSNIGDAIAPVQFHLTFTMDEFAAVLNGRTPLVDFVPQYANVLPYLMMPILGTIGLTVGTFTATMFVLSLTGLLSVFYVFVRVTGRWLPGLLLYLPFLSFSVYRTLSVGDEHFYPANYFAVMPLRYLGPWLVAGLLVWQLRSPSRRRLVCLFTVAGAVMVNNPDFGIPSFGAAVVGAWIGGGRAAMNATAVRRLLAGAATGLALAGAGIVLISLIRSGDLPDFSASLYFARQFALAGFYMLPMPPEGLHLVIALTLAGALVRAAFRFSSPRLQDEQALVLTAALGYASVFGLGASSYYVGRSHPQVLVAVFSAWAFVMALLMWDGWVEVRSSTRPLSGTRVLWGLPLMAIVGQLSLAVAPAWELRDVGDQFSRITAAGGPEGFRDDDTIALVRRHARPGEKVLILAPLSHRIARRAGVRDVFPYNSPESVVTLDQLDEVRGRLEAERVRRVFTAVPLVPEVQDMLSREGFRPETAGDGHTGPVLWQR